MLILHIQIKTRAKISFKMPFSHVIVSSAQWTLYGTVKVSKGAKIRNQYNQVPNSIKKNHVVKIVSTWSISPDENNKFALVYVNGKQFRFRVFTFVQYIFPGSRINIH